ncbi:MAG TPA: radical SAM protein [bacterium]|nr:radical SAM protein [bacterium]
MSRSDPFVSFAPHVVFRGLECPHLFNIMTDELYELDDDGLAFIDEADGNKRESEIKNRELLDFTRSEKLLAFTPRPADGKLARGSSPVPSLRYLEVILTLRCNLRCRHCYLGEPEKKDLDPELLAAAIAEFDAMQGLRLLLSGGEPLLYPRWDRLAAALSGRGFRVVLLTNGVALTRAKIRVLPVHEVQVSLDGLEKGHDALRGPGGFARAVAAARVVAGSGKDLSIATMVHAGNIREMDGLERLVRGLGAREWSLDFPLAAGRWDRESSAGVSLDDAAAAMARGFGSSYHGSGEGHACGLHLASLTPSGDVCQCGFYQDSPLGSVKSGLANAWLDRKVTPLSALEWCRDCEAAAECSGGCRYRAGGTGPDLVMCAAHGWPRGRPPGV